MKKYYKNQKIKQEHLMLSFNKSLDKCFQNIKFYISFTFKFSKLKQYSEAIEECLLSNLPSLYKYYQSYSLLAHTVSYRYHIPSPETSPVIK